MNHIIKHILISVIVAMMLLSSVVLYFKLTEPIPTSSLENRQELLSPIILPKSDEEVKLPAIVQEINARNSVISSIGCDDVELKIWQSGHRFKLTGKIYSEKPTNFRMEIGSIMGKELDIGSNLDVLWYWSRRDRSVGLHYASHTDFHKTRLKTPFSPVFLRSTLGIEPLGEKDVSIVEHENDIVLTYSMLDASGLPIQFSVFVSKIRKQIDGYVVSDQSGKVEASCEIQQYVGDMPTKILYNWYAEKRVMLMVLNHPRLNPVIGPEMWSMPNHTPKLNMAND